MSQAEDGCLVQPFPCQQGTRPPWPGFPLALPRPVNTTLLGLGGALQWGKNCSPLTAPSTEYAASPERVLTEALIPCASPSESAHLNELGN